jgi:hypothetical protein
MLAWLGDPDGQRKPIYDGTVSGLIRCYQTDKNSPYQAVKQNTQRGYDDWCRTLDRAIGKRRVDHLSGHDIRDCFLRVMEPATPGGAPRVRLAKACVRSMLGILVNYGAELGLPGCLELAEPLERMTLRVPQAARRAWKAAKPKKAGMIYEQAAAIVAEGLRRGTRRHRSVALRVAAQFELTLRRVDVIGTWEKLDQAEAVQASAVVERGRIWRSGLRFEDFAAGRLDVETSKTSTQAVYDVTAYPLFRQALAAVPASERMGPLVTDERGRPVTRRYYLALYRDVPDAAGVPRAVWEHACPAWRCDRGTRGRCGLTGYCRARTAHRHQHDAQALHCPVGRDVTSGRQAARRAPPGKAGQSVKMPFPTAFPTRFPQDALSAWYSRVDSNHRPPDPQSAVIARHDPTNPVTCPPRKAVIPGILSSCRELSATWPDTTRHSVCVTPALPHLGSDSARAG